MASVKLDCMNSQRRIPCRVEDAGAEACRLTTWKDNWRVDQPMSHGSKSQGLALGCGILHVLCSFY